MNKEQIIDILSNSDINVVLCAKLSEYIDKIEKENQQLKENNQLYQEEMCRSWENVDNYKSVLDEIREQLKKIKPDLDFEPWSIYKVSGDKLFDLSQILDKEGKE